MAPKMTLWIIGTGKLCTSISGSHPAMARILSYSGVFKLIRRELRVWFQKVRLNILMIRGFCKQ